MSEDPEVEPPAPPLFAPEDEGDNVPRSRRRRHRASSPASWKWSARWFLAEFFVVLTGILVALALNAWWEWRQAAERERTYLDIIAAEFRATEADLEAEIAASERLFNRAQRMVGVFYALQEPPIDSLFAWWRMSHRDPQPTLGTLRALIDTGDLRLIRNDSLRTVLVTIGERSRYYDARLRKWENVIVGTYDALMPMIIAIQNVYWEERGRPDLDGMRLWQIAAAGLPDRLRTPPFVPSIQELRDDEATYRSAIIYMMATWNHMGNQERLLAEVRSARESVEAVID